MESCESGFRASVAHTPRALLASGEVRQEGSDTLAPQEAQGHTPTAGRQMLGRGMSKEPWEPRRGTINLPGCRVLRRSVQPRLKGFPCLHMGRSRAPTPAPKNQNLSQTQGQGSCIRSHLPISLTLIQVKDPPA